MKISLFTAILLVFPFTAWSTTCGGDAPANYSPASVSCGMTLQIEPAEGGLQVRGNLRGYTVDRGATGFEVLDNDGQITLTAVFNVLATDGKVTQNSNGEVIIDRTALRLMTQALERGLSFIESAPDSDVPAVQALLVPQRAARKRALEALQSALTPRIQESGRLPRGFISQYLSPVLLLTRQGGDDATESNQIFTYPESRRSDAASPFQRTLGRDILCHHGRSARGRSATRCGGGVSSYLIGIGTNFCSFKFDSGERYPTSQCTTGVNFEFGTVAPSPAPSASGATGL